MSDRDDPTVPVFGWHPGQEAADEEGADWTPPERPNVLRFDTGAVPAAGIGWPTPPPYQHVPLPADLPPAERLERLLVSADDLADRCADLVRDMRSLPFIAQITEQLTDAHGSLVKVANSIARAR